MPSKSNIKGNYRKTASGNPAFIELTETKFTKPEPITAPPYTDSV